MGFDLSSANSASGRVRRVLLYLALVSLLLAPASSAWAERKNYAASVTYDASEAGHPVKILYFAVYPVGFLLDSLILKPIWWLGQRQPFRTVFGVDNIKSNL